MVAIAEERERLSLSAQPAFRAHGGPRTGDEIEMKVENVGASVRDVELVPINFTGNTLTVSLWEAGQTRPLAGTKPGNDPLEARLSFTDGLGVRQVRTLQLIREGGWDARLGPAS